MGTSMITAKPLQLPTVFGEMRQIIAPFLGSYSMVSYSIFAIPRAPNDWPLLFGFLMLLGITSVKSTKKNEKKTYNCSQKIKLKISSICCWRRLFTKLPSWSTSRGYHSKIARFGYNIARRYIVLQNYPLKSCKTLQCKLLFFRILQDNHHSLCKYAKMDVIGSSCGAEVVNNFLVMGKILPTKYFLHASIYQMKMWKVKNCEKIMETKNNVN